MANSHEIARAHEQGVPASRPVKDSVARPCTVHGCGEPHAGRGHPGKGWIHVKQVTQPDVWLCSWYCLSRFAIRAELGGGDAHQVEGR